MIEQLRDLIPQIIDECQVVLDEWQQDDEGFDEEFGYGGACDAVAEVISGIIVENLEDAEARDGGQPGDNHAWVFVTFDNGLEFGVDIPAHIYERGDGFVWEKLEDVILRPEHVDIWQIS